MTVKKTSAKMSSWKRLERLTLGDLRNELRRYGMTPISTTKAKCIEELTLHLEEEGPLDNLVENQTHEVGKTPNQVQQTSQQKLVRLWLFNRLTTNLVICQQLICSPSSIRYWLTRCNNSYSYNENKTKGTKK